MTRRSVASTELSDGWGIGMQNHEFRLGLRLAHGLLLSATVALAGCAALPGGGPKPLDTYELSAPDGGRDRVRGGVQILIAEPTALKSLDSVNVVIKPAPGSVEYLAGAQWADRLPKVVQARMAEAFQKSGAFGGVGKPGEGLAIDYQVVTEIRSFEVRSDGRQRAYVELFVKILNDRNGAVRAARSFVAEAGLSGQGNAAYFGALDSAFNQATTEIVAWTDGLI